MKKLKLLVYFFICCLLFGLLNCNLFEQLEEFGIPVEEKSVEELNNINDFFVYNSEAWCIGAFPSNYVYGNKISASAVKNSFEKSSLTGPYKSESDLRKDSISIRTLWVGIYVINRNKNQYRIIRFFQAPGARLSEQTWYELTIIDDFGVYQTTKSTN